MNPQIWWYVARAAGIVGWLFLTAAVLWGILLSTNLFPAHRRPAWLLDLHRALGGLAVFTIAIHLGALVADNFVHFTIADLTIPFASEWKTWQVALGVFAFWGVVVVEATSLAMKHLPRRVWRGIHMTSYVTFLAHQPARHVRRHRRHQLDVRRHVDHHDRGADVRHHLPGDPPSQPATAPWPRHPRRPDVPCR